MKSPPFVFGGCPGSLLAGTNPAQAQLVAAGKTKILKTQIKNPFLLPALIAVLNFDPGGLGAQSVYTPYTFTTLAGHASTGGAVAQFNRPSGVAADASGNVYVADTTNSAIRKITPAGVVTTLAGLAGITGSDDGTGSAALFQFPSGVATDSAGNIYVADTINNTIRKGFLPPPPPPPQLTILLSGVPPSGIVLTWPTNAVGFTLQSATSLAPPVVWSTNSPAPVVIAGQYTVTNPISGPQQFYRLSQ